MKRKISIAALVLLAVIAFVPVIFSLRTKPIPVSVKQFRGKTDKGAEAWAQQALGAMSLEEKLAQFFMVNVSSNDPTSIENARTMIVDHKVGGVIYFQGEKINLKRVLDSFSDLSKIPLLNAMDAEWGSSMRLFDGERFPYAYTLGAADDTLLSEQVGAAMARECRELGIHLNFAPVADVNSNPSNPVIGFRSFGENPNSVAKHVRAISRGMESNGVMTCVKHFPGHGNTNKDSHAELPTISAAISELETVDLLPFQRAFQDGTPSVMVGHLNVPALDDSGTPSSLSDKTIKGYLQNKLGYRGLVISDALNMHAVSDMYGKVDVSVKAFKAGCDILLMPEDIPGAIDALKKEVQTGSISLKEINERCLKLLVAKFHYCLHPKSIQKISEGEVEFMKQRTFEKALTVLKNQNETLQLTRLDKKIAVVSIGVHSGFFKNAVSLFTDLEHYHYFSAKEALEEFPEKLNAYDKVIITLHATGLRSKNTYSFGSDMKSFLEKVKTQDLSLVLFGNPLFLKSLGEWDKYNSILVAYENNKYAQKAAAQMIFGALESNGKLPESISEKYPSGFGLQVKRTGRLKFSCPEEMGIDPNKLAEIDKIALNGIDKGAYPGCQIVVALHGNIIYRKSFGKPTFESHDSVSNTDLYDIASISKIAGSTAGIMRLQSMGKFSLDKHLKDYLGKLTENYPAFGSILLRDMLAHQAGLTAWIPFYKRTLKNGEWNPSIYSKEAKKGFTTQVAAGLWIKDTYIDSIYRQIMSSNLGSKKYEYSDLGYYFIKKIIEKESGKDYYEFLKQELYDPMGLKNICYNPIGKVSMNRLIPTENDKVFRKQWIQGYVHDPGAAMLGGIGGHAGCFSNATDLAALFQLFMNGGIYGNIPYIEKDVVEEYTRAQFPGNRRGAGFDRPNASGGGTCHESASQSSYGHSGFTGTLAWADPTYGINYVFLSNRVCPDQDNWKLRDMNIRTEIQRVIYEAVKSRKEN